MHRLKGMSYIAIAENLYLGDALQEKGEGSTPCIPDRKIRNKAVKYDKRRYKRRNRIEMARTGWALLTRNEVYRAPAVIAA